MSAHSPSYPEVPAHMEQQILHHLPEPLCVVAPDRRIAFWNPAAEKLTGYASGEAAGGPYWHYLVQVRREEDQRTRPDPSPVEATLRDGTPRQCEADLLCKDGHRNAVRLTTLSLPAAGESAWVVCLFRDASQEQALRDRMAGTARRELFDPLTGLPTRRSVEATLARSVDEAGRYGTRFGVFFLAVDDFQRVREAHGRDAGNHVLAAVAKAVSQTVRSFDVVARWNGGQFVLVCRAVAGTALRRIAERHRKAIEGLSIRAGETHFRVTVSVGATAMAGQEGVGRLLGRADRMLRAAKRTGGNKVTADA